MHLWAGRPRQQWFMTAPCKQIVGSPVSTTPAPHRQARKGTAYIKQGAHGFSACRGLQVSSASPGTDTRVVQAKAAVVQGEAAVVQGEAAVVQGEAACAAFRVQDVGCKGCTACPGKPETSPNLPSPCTRRSCPTCCLRSMRMHSSLAAAGHWVLSSPMASSRRCTSVVTSRSACNGCRAQGLAAPHSSEVR